jgi:hypothetical protein
MSQQTHEGFGIEVQADFAQASSLIRFRVIGDEDWKATPYQVADTGHDPDRALEIVNAWADAQS